MAYNRKSGINKATAFYTLLSILFGILFGVFCSVVNRVGFLDSSFADKRLELLGYETIIATLIIIITPRRVWAGINSGLFVLISNTFFYFYDFFVTSKFNTSEFIYNVCFAVVVFLISLLVWQYKRSGWFAGFGAAIPLAVLSSECIYLIIFMFSGFSWLTLINILINIGFSVFFYTKIPAANYTRIKTIIFHVVLAVIFTLYILWYKGIIVFVI